MPGLPFNSSRRTDETLRIQAPHHADAAISNAARYEASRAGKENQSMGERLALAKNGV